MQDLARTGCKDAQCLKRNTETLSGACAELLLKPMLEPAPEPSPAPMPFRGSMLDTVSKLLGQDDGFQGTFTMVSTDDDGHSKTVSGPIGSVLPRELMSAFPDLASIFGFPSSPQQRFMPAGARKPRSQHPIASAGDAPAPEPRKEYPTASIGGVTYWTEPADNKQADKSVTAPAPEPRKEYPTASIGGITYWAEPKQADKGFKGPVATLGDDPDDVAAAAASKGHPCLEEIMMCREAVGTATADVRQCLLDHLAQLSPRCKCFVNQVEGPEKMQRQLPASAKAATAPTIHVTTTFEVDEPEFSDPGRPSFARRPHGPHGHPCIFMMAATMVLMVLIVRKCLRCLCRAPTPANMAIVVPPEATSIKLVEPLNAKDIKVVTVAK